MFAQAFSIPSEVQSSYCLYLEKLPHQDLLWGIFYFLLQTVAFSDSRAQVLLSMTTTWIPDLVFLSANYQECEWLLVCKSKGGLKSQGKVTTFKVLSTSKYLTSGLTFYVVAITSFASNIEAIEMVWIMRFGVQLFSVSHHVLVLK